MKRNVRGENKRLLKIQDSTKKVQSVFVIK